MASNYVLLGAGRNREVYLLPSNKYVLKVPKNSFGIADNFTEYHRYRNRDKWYPLARCRIVAGTNLLVMEFLNLIVKEYPDWAGYVDCRQVGYNKQGHLVAYDYGYY